MDAAECNYTPKKRHGVSIDGNGAVLSKLMYYEPKTTILWCLICVHPTPPSQILHHLYNILLQCTSCRQGGDRIRLTQYRLDHPNTSPKTITFHLIPMFPRTTVPHLTLSITPTGDDNSDRRCQWIDLEPWIQSLPNMCLSSHGAIRTSSRSHGQSRTRCEVSTGLNCRTDEPLTLHCPLS